MRAVVFDRPGDESVLRVAEAPAPLLGPGDLRIRVRAFAVNRADLLQRQGLYPPPPGASEILGLECAGEVAEVGEAVSGWRVGERAMALLSGGGYAEEVVVAAGSAMRVPERLGFEQAAAVPEVFLTAFLNVFEIGALPEGGWLLVHGGGSGIGTASIQLARAAGAHVAVTAGSDEKCRRCRELGADVAVNYREGDFVAAVREASGGKGAHVVLDSIGAPYLERNLASLRVGGCLVLIGLMGGSKAEIGLGPLLVKRLRLVGSTLRTRSDAEKAALVRAFEARFGSDLASGLLAPVVDRVLPMERAGDAHRAMKSSEHFGKIVLVP
jgi:tumor protein p53-inducible protein 3